MAESGGTGRYLRMRWEQRRLRSILEAGEKILSPALAALAAVACGWLLIIWWPSSQPPPRGEARPPEAAVYAARPLPPLSSYKVIVERDIFSPVRRGRERSFDGTVRPVPSVIRPPSGLDLVGTVLLGTKRVAIMRAGGPGGRPGEYVVGDTVAGYTVRDIQRDRVVLERGGRSFEVTMRMDSALRPASAGRPGQAGYGNKPPASSPAKDTSVYHGHAGRLR